MSEPFKNAGVWTISVLALAVLAGCGQKAADQGVIQLADPGPAVETVNGQPVPQRLLDALARARNWDISKPEFRERALKELTGLVLVADAARDEKFANDPDFAATVELSRLQGISAASYAEFQKRCGKVHPNGPLQTKPWGTKEFGAIDPNGVCVTFQE